MRRIVCETCAPKWEREPIQEGFQCRFARGKTKQPTQEQRTVKTTVEGDTFDTKLDPGHYNCDDCNVKLPAGTPAVAVSMWREGTSYPPWEANFMDVETTETQENFL